MDIKFQDFTQRNHVANVPIINLICINILLSTIVQTKRPTTCTSVLHSATPRRIITRTTYTALYYSTLHTHLLESNNLHIINTILTYELLLYV